MQRCLSLREMGATGEVLNSGMMWRSCNYPDPNNSFALEMAQKEDAEKNGGEEE